MELSFYGANCFRLATKQTTVVIDDNLADLGAKTITADADVSVVTQQRIKATPSTRLNLDMPGEYELADLTVIGIQARSYTDNEDERTATIFKFISGPYQLVVLGHVHPKLSEKTLEAIGVVDVLMVPVGGTGYTLDAEDATNVIKLIEPKIVIPCHYESAHLNYEVPQRSVADFFAKLAIPAPEPIKTLKLKGEIEPSVLLLEDQSA